MTFLQSLRQSTLLPLCVLATMFLSFAPHHARADDAAPAPSVGAGGAGGFDTSMAAAAAGSSKGSGSAVSVDTSTGAMQTSIPIESPKARGAVQPGLAMSYSSTGGWGLGGQSWSLGVSSIERQPRSGHPQYHDPANGALLDPAVEDQFAFNGHALAALGLVSAAQEEGIPSFATGGGWTYFRQINDDFTRFFWSPDHQTWIVQTKNGETLELGVPLSATFSDPKDQVGAIDLDTQAEPGKPASVPFRWNLSVRYDSQGGFGHAVNRIVYRWAHLDIGTLANLGYLTDVYDTPKATAADSLSTDPSIFAHHIQIAYKASGRRWIPIVPVWRAQTHQVIDYVTVSTAEDGVPQRALLHRYSMRYAADAKNPQILHLSSVGIEGRCATPLYENANFSVPTATRCTTQPQSPSMTYTGQTAFNANTTAAQIVSLSVNMPVKGSIPKDAPPGNGSFFGYTAPVNPYIYDVDGDGRADIVYADNDGSSTVTAPTRQWVSTNGTTFTAIDNVVAPQPAFGDLPGYVPFAPGDFVSGGPLSVLYGTDTFRESIVTPLLQPNKTWHWNTQTAHMTPLDTRTVSAGPVDQTAPYNGHPPAEGLYTEAERTFAVTDVDGDGYLDELTATDVDQYGWVYSAHFSGGEYYGEGYHRRVGSFLGLRSTQKQVDRDLFVFGNYAADRVNHAFVAPASNVLVPSSVVPGTQYVGRLDAPNLLPFKRDPFLAPTDTFIPPAVGPMDASLMYQEPFFADMNGDGLPDWVTIPTVLAPTRSLYYWPGHGDGTFGDCAVGAACSTSYTGGNAVQIQLPARPVQSSGAVDGSLEDPERYVHDVTGDGLADLIVVDPQGIDVYRNIDGLSFSATKTSHTDKSVLPGYDIVGRSCDVNHQCHYTKDIQGQNDPTTKISFGDIAGDGNDSIVVMNVVNNGTNASNAYRVDVHSINLLGTSVGLLETHKNGSGLTTTVTYQSTTTQSNQASLPTSTVGAWTRTMPMVKTVVSHFETTNNLPGVLEEHHSTDMAYQDPVYDGQDHLFRGFKKVVRFDRNDAQNNGLYTATSFLTGNCDADQPSAGCATFVTNHPFDTLRGLPWLTETYSQDGAYLSSVINSYEVRTTSHAFIDARNSFYVVPTAKDSLLYDGAPTKATTPQSYTVAWINDPTTTLRDTITHFIPAHFTETGAAPAHLLTRSNFDTNGNVTDVWDDGVSGHDDSIHTTYKWTRLGTDWTWRITQRHVDALPGTANGIDRDLDVNYYYDNFGNAIAASSPLVGTATATRHHETGLEVADSPPNASADGATVFAQSVNYDAYGNVYKSSKGSGNSCSLTAYDPTFKLFPASQSTYTQPNCLGSAQTSTMGFDWGAGQPKMIVDVTGAIATKSYDAFGRLTTVAKPDPHTGAAMATTLTLTYADATDNPIHVVQAATNDGLGTSQSWTYTEPFGHELLTISPSDTAHDPKQWIVSGAALRDSNGKTITKYDPYFWSGTPGSYPLTATGYDMVGAIAKRYTYDGFGRIVATTGRDGLQDARWVYHALSTDAFDAEQLRGAHQGAFTTTTKDGHGRQVARTERFHDAAKALHTLVSATIYSARGQPLVVTKDGALRHTMTYDSLGRLVANYEPNTTRMGPNQVPSWIYSYDNDGNLVGTTDVRGCGENIYYDGRSRILAEDYSPCLAAQAPHSKPNLTTGDGTESFYQYDAPAVGQVGGGMAIAWLGHLAQVSDRGSRTRFSYDMRGRLTGVGRQIAAPGAPIAALATRYAPTWSNKAMTYDDRDRPSTESTGADVAALIPSTTSGSVTSIAYSGRGTPSQVTSTYSASPLIKSHSFDADGFPLTVAYGDSASTTDVSVPDPVLRSLASFAITRKAPGNWASPVAPYTSPKTALTTQTTLESVTIKPDLIGNPTTLTDNRIASEWPDGSKPATKTFAYDDLYRATSATTTYATSSGKDTQVSPFAAELAKDATSKTALTPLPQPNRQTSESFAYDTLGNMTSWADDANAFFDRSIGTITNGGTNLGPNQLTHAQGATSDQSLDATYDPGGNLQVLTVAASCTDYNGTCQHRFEYAWDEIGQLAHAKRWDLPSLRPGIFPTPVDPKVEPGADPDADLAFVYDASGRRVLKSAYQAGVLAGTSVDIFPSLRLQHAAWKSGDYERSTDTEAIYLTVAGASFGRVVYSSSDPVLNASGSTHVFLEIGDHLGSTSVVIDQASGELVERTTYSAYGNTDSDYRPERWNSFRESYRFTGQEDDSEIGLTYFGARYYAPQLGRFISPDPVAVHSLGSDPNPYAYVKGHVSSAVDTNGLECLQEICIASPGAGTSPSFQLPMMVVEGSVSPAGWLVQYMASMPEEAGMSVNPMMSPEPEEEAWATEVASPGATWSSKALNMESWNPNATSMTDAMLLGSYNEMSWAHANPYAARVTAKIGLTVLPWVPVIGSLMLASEAMDPTLSPGSRVFSGVMAAASILPIGRIIGKVGQVAWGIRAAEGAEVLFGQASVARTFTTAEAGSTFKYAGQSIADVAAGLRSGAISASEIPVEAVKIEGRLVAVNNRSLTALTRAGIRPTNIIDVSGNAGTVGKVLGRLGEMGGAPSTTIRIRGIGPGASAIY